MRKKHLYNALYQQDFPVRQKYLHKGKLTKGAEVMNYLCNEQ